MRNRMQPYMRPNYLILDVVESPIIHYTGFSHESLERQYEIPDIGKEVKEMLKSAECILKNINNKKVYIQNLRDPSLELKQELIIHLEQEGDIYSAISYDLGQYGQGISEEDAIQDLCEIICEYYYLLASEKKPMSKNLRAHLDYMKSVIRERDANKKT